MPEVVGIRFKPVTKIYYFLPPADDALMVGDPVIVETARGQELGWVAMETTPIDNSDVRGKLKPVLRKATPIDLMDMKRYQGRRLDALEKCKQKVADLNLPMKVIDAEYSFDGSRVLFAFSAEQRVDFRDLVRHLVRSLRARVEMRQIGARDEAKIIDGYGRCGRRLCCSSWLTEFHPVSIRMAKNQQLPLAPTEISGVCGRLLCCLAYEDQMYTEIKKTLPKVGSTVKTESDQGVIRGLNILKQTVIVDLGEGNGRVEVPVEEISVLQEPEKKKSQQQQGQQGSSSKKRRRRRSRRKKNQPKGGD